MIYENKKTFAAKTTPLVRWLTLYPLWLMLRIVFQGRAGTIRHRFVANCCAQRRPNCPTPAEYQRGVSKRSRNSWRCLREEARYFRLN